MQSVPYALWFADVDTHDVQSVGKRSRDLAELTQAGFPIIPGFIVTTAAYFDFLKETQLDIRIPKLLTTVNFDRPESIMQVTNHIKHMFDESQISQSLGQTLEQYFNQLGATTVRLHAYTRTKDMPKHSESTAKSYKKLATKVKNAWATHFSAGLLAHRNEHNLDHMSTGTEIIIQQTISTKKTGKLYTIDKNSHTKERLVIQTIYPHKADIYKVSKKTLMILDRILNHHVKAPKLTLDEIQSLAKIGCELEHNRYFPQEIDWAITENAIYIVSTKPLSSIPQEKEQVANKPAIAKGTSITTAIATGVVKIIAHKHDLQSVRKNDIVVIDSIQTTDLKHLKKAKAILCQKGNQHSEVATKLRNHGIPTLFHITPAKHLIKNGAIVTVHAGKGKIYSGSL